MAIARQGGPVAIALATLLAIVQLTAAAYWIWRDVYGAVATAIGLCLLWAMLAPAVYINRTPTNRSMCQSNLRQLVLALHNYHDVYDSLPPVYVTDKTGRPLYSWRVLLLPYLEQQNLYAQFHLDEPWDSPHNLTLVKNSPDVFKCPTANKSGDTVTPYVALVGPQSMWPGEKACSFADITDGTSNTIALIEWPESDIVWSEPRDLPADNLPLLTKLPQKTLRSKKRHGREGGVTVGLADGSVHHLEMPKLSPLTVRALISRAGGEKIENDD